MNGLKEVWGNVRDENLELPFFGTVKNDNIVMVGLNLRNCQSVRLFPIRFSIRRRVSRLPQRQMS